MTSPNAAPDSRAGRHRAAWDEAHRIFAETMPRYRAALRDCEGVQQCFLSDLLLRNRDTKFGREHGFTGIATYADFAARIPLQTYEALAPYIAEITAGARNILTAEDPLFVEETGGSSGGAKVIPYTPASLASLHDALFPFYADLLDRRPGIKDGRAYFAISPVGREARSRVGMIPLGSPDDSTYFGDAAAPMRSVWAVPPAVALVTDLDAWKSLTMRLLLGAADLSYLSVWSPTYLIELVNAARRSASALSAAIASGTLGIETLGVEVPDIVRDAIGPLRPNPDRAALVKRSIGLDRFDAAALWPGLDTINCWLDATSAAFGRELQALFPKVYLHPKGLLSTEAVVTLPFGEDPSPLLAVESAFFEFAAEDGSIALAHQIEADREYRVIVSNHCGLYRYDTGDLVRVTGHETGTPRMRFRGRAGLFTDLCGEKLSETFVLACFERRALPEGVTAFIVPRAEPRPHYALYVDAALGSAADAAILADRLDAALRANPQYAYARNLGQLGHIAAHRLPDAFAAYRENASAEGRAIGTVKPPVLVKSFPESAAEEQSGR